MTQQLLTPDKLAQELRDLLNHHAKLYHTLDVSPNHRRGIRPGLPEAEGTGENPSGTGRTGVPHPAGRGPGSRRIRPGRTPRTHAQPQQRLHQRGIRGLAGPDQAGRRPQPPRLRRAKDRRAGGTPPVRAGQARHGRHQRRRQHRRGRNPQRPHRPEHPPGPPSRRQFPHTRRTRAPGRNLYAQEHLRKGEPGAGGEGRVPVRQSQERRRRDHAATRPPTGPRARTPRLGVLLPDQPSPVPLRDPSLAPQTWDSP